MILRAVMAACALLAAGTLAVGRADAHVQYGTNWYFQGLTLGDGDNPSDPINFIFVGGSADPSNYYQSRIEDHIADDWDTGVVGGAGWRKDSQIVGWCKNDQKVVWASPGNTPSTIKEKTDWHGGTSTRNICGPQHHARFWDDYDHRLATTGHGDPYKWVIGGIHHEKWTGNIPRPKKKRPIKHKIDRDWDVVRVNLTDAMKLHCSFPAWRQHSGAKLDRDAGQGFDNEGWIARISLAHIDPDSGCAGQLDTTNP